VQAATQKPSELEGRNRLPARSEKLSAAHSSFNLANGYSMHRVIRYLLEAIFSPPRAVYNPDFTVSVITCNSCAYERAAVQFTSDSRLNLMGSLWRDCTHRDIAPTVCLIYLHSLGTNQFEMLDIIPFLCTPELAMFAFDFPGCGISEGKAIPLDGSGCELVLAAVRHLRAHFAFTQFALWGRSLGASIALHTVSNSNDFRCVVADSPFASTRDFLYDQAHENKIPKCLIKMALPIVQAEARRMTGVNIDYPFPINFVQYAQTPVMLGHGTRDHFVPARHSEAIFSRYGDSHKQLCTFDVKHNSRRPSHWYRTVARFIYRQVGLDTAARSYDQIYAASELHVGTVSMILRDIHEAKEREAEAAAATEAAKAEEGEMEGQGEATQLAVEEQTKEAEASDTSDEICMVVFPDISLANMKSVVP
jgi:pimeloyl-ACP methyl ester carboxylesterase